LYFGYFGIVAFQTPLPLPPEHSTKILHAPISWKGVEGLEGVSLRARQQAN